MAGAAQGHQVRWVKSPVRRPPDAFNVMALGGDLEDAGLKAVPTEAIRKAGSAALLTVPIRGIAASLAAGAEETDTEPSPLAVIAAGGRGSARPVRFPLVSGT
jgi:hypothetical protein